MILLLFIALIISSGPTRIKEGWRIRNSIKFKKLVKNIVKYAKAQTIKWRGHRNGMEDIKLVKKITE